MSSLIQDNNYQRCHQAIQLVAAEAASCIKRVLTSWHDQAKKPKKTPEKTLLRCTNPKDCSALSKKPKTTKGSCSECEDWGEALEREVYPSQFKGSLSWGNVDSSLIYDDPIEVAKLFVLRLQAGAVFTDTEEFDAASLLMMMMKFKPFHQGDQAIYSAIDKVSAIRNDLAHIEVKKDLKLEDHTTDGYFQTISDLVACLTVSPSHPHYFSRDTAQRLQQALQDIRTDKFDLDACREELRRVYEDETAKISLLPFDAEGLVDVDDIYVDLSLESDDPQPQSLGSYDELFQLKKRGSNNSESRVLLKGEPGSGKTTLAAKIASDWVQKGSGKQFGGLSKYDLLFVLNMRYIEEDMSLVDVIFDQLLPSDTKVSKKGLEKYITRNADKVAVILDGADEFRTKIQRSKDGKLIVDVLCNNLLNKSLLVVTTRPHLVSKVKEFGSYRHVRVGGFANESFFEFIGKFFNVVPYKGEAEFFEKQYTSKNYHEEDIFQGKAQTKIDQHSVDRFIMQIRLGNSMKFLTHIPVILCMLCLLWREFQKLPDRLSDLYKETIQHFTLRWKEKHSNLDEDDDLDSQFGVRLGHIALTCLLENRLYFTSKEFQTKEILQKAIAVGIIVKERKRSKLHNFGNFVFLHKTFQEYYAAKYLISLVSSPKLDEYLSQITVQNVDTLEHMLLFSCGLNSTTAGKMINHCVNLGIFDVIRYNSCYFGFGDKSFHYRYLNETWRRCLHLLHESQSSKLHQVLLKLFSANAVGIWISSQLPKDQLLYMDYFLRSFEESVSTTSSYDKNQILSTIKVDIFYHGMKEDKTKSVGTNLFHKNISFSSDIVRMTKIVVCLMKHSARLLNIELEINYDTEITLPLAFRFLDIIAEGGVPFKSLHVAFKLKDRVWEYMWDVSEDLHGKYMQWFIGLGVVMSNFEFPISLKVSSDWPIDVSLLLYGISSDKISNVVGLELLTCRYREDVLNSLLSKLKKVKCIRNDQTDPRPENIETAVSMSPLLLQTDFIDPVLSYKTLPVILNTIYTNCLSISLLDICGAYIGSNAIPFPGILSKISHLSLRQSGMDWNGCQSLLSQMPLENRIRHICVQGGTSDKPADFYGLLSDVIGSRNRSCPPRQQQSTDSLHSIVCALLSFISTYLSLGEGWLCGLASVSGLFFLVLLFCTFSFSDAWAQTTFTKLKMLTYLDVSSMGMSPEHIRVLSNGLKYLNSLEVIDVSNNIVSKSCVEFSRGLRQSNNLTCLILRNGELVNTDILELSRALRDLVKLVSIDLSRNMFSFKGVYELACSFRVLPELTKAVLSDNPIGDLGVEALCHAIQHCARFQHLAIENCGVTSSGALLLASSFQFMPNLTVLSVSRNEIGYGVRWIFEKLQTLPKLEQLGINDIHLPLKECEDRWKLYLTQMHCTRTKEKGTEYVQFPELNRLYIDYIIENSLHIVMERHLRSKTISASDRQ